MEEKMKNWKILSNSKKSTKQNDFNGRNVNLIIIIIIAQFDMNPDSIQMNTNTCVCTQEICNLLCYAFSKYLLYPQKVVMFDLIWTYFIM